MFPIKAPLFMLSGPYYFNVGAVYAATYPRYPISIGKFLFDDIPFFPILWEANVLPQNLSSIQGIRDLMDAPRHSLLCHGYIAV